MSLSHYYQPGCFGLSFELFPPKTSKGDVALYRHVAQLVEFQPSFITCTYGAGGSTQNKTLDVCQQVKKQFGVPVASHLTLVGSTVDQLRAYLTEAQQRNIDYIVALRGDPPQGESTFQKVDGGLEYANQLVELMTGEFPQFEIAVAGYPETHLEAPSWQVDLDNLKRKVDAGADVILTQLFYDNSDFFRFVDRCQQAGIEVPIVPGVLPIINWNQIQRITSLCGAKLPESLIEDLQKQELPEAQFRVGVDYAVRQVQDLVNQGVPGIHFYVLNRSQATAEVLRTVKLHGAPATGG